MFDQIIENVRVGRRDRAVSIYGKCDLPGVHAPPEDVPEDADLLILNVLERVVFVRVFFAVKAAQANT